MPYSRFFDFILVGAVLGYLIMMLAFKSYLKRAHPQTWAQLGSPSIIPRWTLRAFMDQSIPVLKFLFSDRYKVARDARLTRLVWAVRVLLLGCLGLIAYTLLQQALS